MPAQGCALPLLYVKGAINIRSVLRVEGILGIWEARRFRTKSKLRGVNRLRPSKEENENVFPSVLQIDPTNSLHSNILSRDLF